MESEHIAIIALILTGAVFYILTLSGAFLIANLLFNHSRTYVGSLYLDTTNPTIKNASIAVNTAQANSQNIDATIQFVQTLKQQDVSAEIMSNPDNLNISKFAIVIIIILLFLLLFGVIGIIIHNK